MIIPPELLVMICCCFATLGVQSANPMFDRFNRPVLFRGRYGEHLFAFICLITVLSSISTLIWSFASITWYINILLIAGSVSIFDYISNFLPPTLTQSAVGPIVAAIGLLIAQYLMWFV